MTARHDQRNNNYKSETETWLPGPWWRHVYGKETKENRKMWNRRQRRKGNAAAKRGQEWHQERHTQGWLSW